MSKLIALIVAAACATQALAASAPERPAPAASAASPATASPAAVPVPALDKASQRYGYRDAAGRWLIPAQFADAGKFSGGLAFIENPDGSTGLIDITGAMVAPNVQAASWIALPMSTEATASEGLLAARDSASNKVGFLDSQGRWVIAPRFADAFEFHEGLAAFRMKEGGKVGFVDRKGRVVIAAKFGTNFRTPPVFSEGLAAVGADDNWPRTNADPPGRLGYIDRSGRWVLPPRYSSGENFFNGSAKATVGEREVVLRHPGKR